MGFLESLGVLDSDGTTVSPFDANYGVSGDMATDKNILQGQMNKERPGF